VGDITLSLKSRQRGGAFGEGRPPALFSRRFRRLVLVESLDAEIHFGAIMYVIRADMLMKIDVSRSHYEIFGLTQ